MFGIFFFKEVDGHVKSCQVKLREGGGGGGSEGTEKPRLNRFQ